MKENPMIEVRPEFQQMADMLFELATAFERAGFSHDESIELARQQMLASFQAKN